MSTRGQTIVLFALTLLALALMAFLTLGLGVRVKERMELQTAADAAAYSNAVAIARTFNSLAIVNRTEWSLLVAQSAAQSYISWATAYRAAVEGLGDALVAGDPPCAPLRAMVSLERARVVQAFEASELAAFRELWQLGKVQDDLLQESSRRDYSRLEELVNEERITNEVLRSADDGFSWKARSVTPPYDHERTLSRDCWTGVACDMKSRDFMLNRPGFLTRENYLDGQPNWLIVRHQHEIVMGTRGDPFTTDRLGGRAIAGRLSVSLGGFAAVQWRSATGNSYRQTDGVPTHGSDFMVDPQGNARYPQMHPGGAMSDDHGWLSVSAPGCAIRSIEVEAVVRSDALAQHNLHYWTSNGVRRECPLAHDSSHSLRDLGYLHSWPLIIDFNDGQPNPEGDPKHYAPRYVPGWGRFINQQPTFWVSLERLPRRQDPWDLHFTFGGFSYDARRPQPSARSRGLAYYHRGDDWREPANFVNPFWQATLISTRWEQP